MIYLVLSVLSSTLLGFIFKLFPRYGVHTFQAIVVNYFVCVLCAWVVLGSFPLSNADTTKSWFPFAITLGIIFVAGFNIVAYTIQQFGVTIGIVMQKMSILISVSVTILFYGEAANWLKVLGIIISVAAIWLTNKPSREALLQLTHKPRWLLIFPTLTLFISGIIEVLLYHVEHITGESADINFVATLFGMAGVIGLLVMLPGLVFNKLKWQFKNVLAGFALGIPNFFSIYFLLKLLGVGWGGSVVFPVNNVSIIAFSALLAMWFFNEKLSKTNLVGVLCSVIAIILIGLGK